MLELGMTGTIWLRTTRDVAALVAVALLVGSPVRAQEPVPLFDGRTLEGWEGDQTVFRVESGAIVGGSLTRSLAQSEYLCTTREYADFEVHLRARLEGEGDLNGGVQFRSQRVADSNEVGGYQADLGWIPSRVIPMLSDVVLADTTGVFPLWGTLIDQFRPDPGRYPAPGPPVRLLSVADRGTVLGVLRRGDWNELAVLAVGDTIEVRLNGVLTAQYLESSDVPTTGRICLQVHAGPPSRASYRDIRIQEFRPPPD